MVNDEHQREVFDLSSEMKRLNLSLDQMKELLEERQKEIDTLSQVQKEALKSSNEYHSQVLKTTITNYENQFEKLRNDHVQQLNDRIMVLQEEFAEKARQVQGQHEQETLQLRESCQQDKEAALAVSCWCIQSKLCRL